MGVPRRKPPEWMPDRRWRPPGAANDNQPFRMRPRRPFGRRVPKAPRPIPRGFRFPKALPLAPLLWLPDLLDPAGWFPPQNPKPRGLPSGNWTRTHGPYSWPSYGLAQPLIEPTPFFSNSNYPGRITGQAISHDDYVWPGSRDIGYWWYYGTDVQRSASYERWTRPDYGRIDYDPNFPGQMGRPALPAGFLAPFPDGDMYPSLPGSRDEVPSPWRSPHEQTEKGYEPPEPPGREPPGNKRPLPWFPGYIPERDYQPGTGPGSPRDPTLSTSWDVVPDLVTEPKMRLEDRVRRPARQGEKERKFRAADQKLYRILTNAFGAATEAADFVHALWNALPKNRKGGFWWKKDGGVDHKGAWMPKANAFERAKLVYDHFDEIDVAKALRNLAIQQAQDAAIGKANQYVNKTWKPYLDRIKRPVGIGFKGWTRFG